MATILSVASGKGGVGRSVVASNLGLLLARQGMRVVLVDLDIGGPDLHLLFGILSPTSSLTDFLYKRIPLEEVAQPCTFCPDLRIIPGTGDTLATANLPFSRKQRLIRHLSRIDADLILVDVGAGTNYHALDFFLLGDHLLAVATPDPTAVLDLYRFIKLAAIRKVLTTLALQGPQRGELLDRDFTSLNGVLEAVGPNGADASEQARKILQDFRPCLILNRVTRRWRLNTLRLRMLLKEYVGGDLITLGEIPEDEAVEASVRAYLPVVDHAPASPAARALRSIARRMLHHLDRIATPSPPKPEA